MAVKKMKVKWSSVDWGPVLGLCCFQLSLQLSLPPPLSPVRSVIVPQRSCAAEPQRQRWEAMPPRGQAPGKAGQAQHVWALPAPAWPMMKHHNTPQSTGSQRVGRDWTMEQHLLVTHYVSNVLTVSCMIFKTTSWGGSEGKVSACNAETQVQSLGREDPLEKEMATHSNILAWRTPWIEEPDRLQSMRSQESDMT